MDLTLILGLIILLIIIVVLLYVFSQNNKTKIKEKQSPFIEKNQQHSLQEQPIKQSGKEVYIKEITTIVKIPCIHCGTLNEITEKQCSYCGAVVGKK